MRIGLVEFLLILAIASLTVGPQVALFVDRWVRRANRANARAARRRAEYAAQMAAERDALLKRFRTASTVFGVCILLALVYALVFRPIDTPPQSYAAPEVRRSTGAVQTALSADSRDVLALGDYQGVDCIREQDGFVYAAAYNGATLKKRKSDLVRTDGGSFSAILSVDGELTGFAFDADGDLWLTILTPGGGALCRARHDSWGAAVEQVVTQIDGAPLGAVSAVTTGPDGKVYFAVAGGEAVDNGLEAALRTELLAHTGTGWVYVYDPADRSVQRVGGGVAGGAHVKGEVVDTGNALEGEGPFSPERSGTLPSGALVDLCFSGKYTEQEIRRMITGNGGLLAYTVSTDMQELMRRAATDAKVREVIDAFHYRVAKEIGAMAAAMKGQVDQIILTGGIAHGQETVDALKGYVSWIAPVTVYPGEGELLALAEGALRVLRGEETAKIYE